MIWAALLIVAIPPAAPEEAGWPCDVQPKPTLSVREYWPDADRMAMAQSADPAVTALAQAVSRRSLAEAEAVAQVDQFAAAHPAAVDRARLAAAMADTIDGERSTIIDGIRRFDARQAQLAKRIEEGYTALDAPAATLTPERKAALEDQARWDQQIFEDRQRMLPIVCRQPAALEKRLAALIDAVKAR